MEPADLRDGGDSYSSFEPTTLTAGQAGQTLTVRMRIVNSGQPVYERIYVAFYASLDRTITTSDLYLGRVGVDIWGSQATDVTFRGAFPTNVPAGSYYLGWIIDSPDWLAEADKTNNTAYRSTPRLQVVNPSMVIYVDARARGTNDGSSWKNAFASLQDALAVAPANREIRLAGGVYTPDRGAGIVPGDREARFRLGNGVTIRGGYGGAGASDPDVRDIRTYATILSGDLRGDDRPVAAPCDLWKEPSRTDNSRHVLAVVGKGQTATLDAVQVTGGYAFGPSVMAVANSTQGGGLLLTDGSLTLRQCTFVGNWAAGDGGAVYVAGGRLELSECTFGANGAGTDVGLPRGTGGAIGNDGTGQLTLSRCALHDNFAGVRGGALHNDKGTVTITWSRFLRNRAGDSGGGAIWNSEGRLSLVNCLLHGNRSDFTGGAIVNISRGSLLAVNCCLHANDSRVQAGALENSYGGTATLWNCTLAANRQGSGSRAIVCAAAPGQTGGELTIANSILWNGGGEIANSGAALVTVGHSNVQGGWPGIGNLNVDPRFVLPAGPDGVAGTEDDNPRLQPGSPCIDRGDNSLLPQDFADIDGDGNVQEPLPLDLDGRPRAHGTAVDLGAYETQPASSAASSSPSSSCD